MRPPPGTPRRRFHPAVYRRRRVIALIVVLIVVNVGGGSLAVLGDDSDGARSVRADDDRGDGGGGSDGDGAVAGDINAIAAENALPGGPDWGLNGDVERIEGYADRTSVARDEPFRLFVSTTGTTFTVQAFRMGWYDGIGSRLVWSSEPVGGAEQAPPRRDPDTNMVDAPWDPSLTVTPDESWAPGMYLLRLNSDDGGANFVPMTVRDDCSDADILFVSAVTTWQAYNAWGGADLDEGPAPLRRATVVSFDRPDEGDGTGHFLGGEYELVQQLESQGLDVAYVTNIDVHARPELTQNHRVVISLAHDEYYSPEMRQSLEAARDAGVNLLFLGANAVFRRIRLEESSLGPHRLEVNFRRAELDPLDGVDPAQVTTNWRASPDPRPESALIGNYYECNPVEADMVIVRADAWMFDGTGLTDGALLPGLVGNEYDRVTPEAPTPANIEVLAHSPVTCGDLESHADVTYYTADSGAGVFATGTLWWERQLGPLCPTDETPTRPECQVRLITQNIVDVVAAGPGGETHPSQPNLEDLGIGPLEQPT
ncbi:hypothetical protein BH18ACT4_BH18ACT4_13250 [soil metagenome]